MQLAKALKRIEKRVSRGFHGYPMISISYFGTSQANATRVDVGFIEQENATPLVESFTSSSDLRQDETVQTTIIKIIDRVGAKTVVMDNKVQQLT